MTCVLALIGMLFVASCAQPPEEDGGETGSESSCVHEMGNYVANNDADCQHNMTETATCSKCGEKDTRELANSKNPAVHTSEEVKYRENGTDANKHDKYHACCQAIIETVDHRYGEGVSDTENAGVTVYICADCGAVKKTHDGAHTHKAILVDATPAGCTAFGNIEYWYCAGCDTRFADGTLTTILSKEDVRVSPSHKGGTATCTAAAVCTACGEAYGSLDPENHASASFEYVEMSTDDEKHERRHACCHTVVSTEVHTWNNGTVNGDVTVYTCTKCGKEKREANALHVHTSTHVLPKAATCTEEGNIEYWHCAACGKYFSDEALTQEVSAASVKTDPAHTSTEFTYAPNAIDPERHDKKHACCGTVVETLAHAYESAGSFVASCEENGYTLYQCVCGESYREFTAPATGHNVELWSLTLESPKTGADCTYLQTFEGECFFCGEELEKTTETVRHRYAATVVTQPTCQSAGSKSYACSCGAKPTPDTVSIPKNPHAHTWEAGTTENGVTTYRCENCTASKTSVVSLDTQAQLDKTQLNGNEIVLGDVALTLDNTVLGLIDDNGDVTLSAAPVTEGRAELVSSLPEALRAQITDSTPIYDFSLSQGGNAISNFEEGRVTVTIPYTLPNDADADRVAVWYVSAQGLKFYAASYYGIGENGFVTFEAEHFSVYLPGIAPADEACALYGHNYTTSITSPTCVEPGYTEYHCQRCSHSKLDDILTALGHAYSAGNETPSTCLVPGERTYSCARDDCDHTYRKTLPLAAHTFVKDTEESVEKTCTEDGLDVYKCSVAGCNGEKRETLTAYGHDLYEVSIGLAEGAQSCHDGVAIGKKCRNCDHTETEILTGTHVDYEKYMTPECTYPSHTDEYVYLGSYLTAAGIAYDEEPYLAMTPGCVCGELYRSVRMENRGMAYGMELFNDFVEFSHMSFFEETRVLTATSMPMGGPGMPGYTEPSSYSICFDAKIVKGEGCHTTFRLTLKLGYNEASGECDEEMVFVLADRIEHGNVKTVATLSDPTKSCYENSRNEGLTVTRYCLACDSLIETFSEYLPNSSSHYFVDKETLEHKHDPSDPYYCVRVNVSECPCGQIQWRDYRANNGSYTTTYVGNTAVYSCNSCHFIYAECENAVAQDAEDCRETRTDHLYFDCESVNNFESCEKTLVNLDYDTAWHASYRNETNKNAPEATDQTCCYYYYDRLVCERCGFVTHNSVDGYRMIHELVENSVTDARKNVTKTTTCTRDGCEYLCIELRDADGNLLRRYCEAPDHTQGELCISLTANNVTNGVLRPTIEREEYYDLETGAAKRWYQFVYTYATDPMNGCIQTQTFTNSNGDCEVHESPCCLYDIHVSQEGNCVQDAYSKYVCSLCGGERIDSMGSSFGHSFGEYYTVKQTDGNSDMYFPYYKCEVCGIYRKNTDNYSPISVTQVGVEDGVVTIAYRDYNQGEAAPLEEPCFFVAYQFRTSDEALRVDEIVDGYIPQPLVDYLEGIDVTDNGEGLLTYQLSDVAAALEVLTPLEDGYVYKVCLMVGTDPEYASYILVPLD